MYIVCPAVDQEDPEGLKAAEQYGRQLQEEVFPDLRVGIVHGKQKARDKQGVMAAFAAGKWMSWYPPRSLRWGWTCPTPA